MTHVQLLHVQPMHVQLMHVQSSQRGTMFDQNTGLEVNKVVLTKHLICIATTCLTPQMAEQL